MLRRTLRQNSGFQKIKGHDPLVTSRAETESIMLHICHFRLKSIEIQNTPPSHVFKKKKSQISFLLTSFTVLH